MISGAIVDTGALVALINRKDTHHLWAREVWKQLCPPLLVCEPVITEACFLLQDLQNGESSILRLLETNVIQNAIDRLMQRYQSVPMSLADACLVRMLELYPNSSILTLDQDFYIYRKQGNQSIDVMMPRKS
jgi:predicted nucleic acid-binding protein